MGKAKLDKDQRIEMLTKIRELRRTGKPEKAAEIQAALDRNEYFFGSKDAPVEDIKPPSKGAKLEAWVEFAKKHSQIDPEVIDNTSRDDLIKMLKANGLVE